MTTTAHRPSAGGLAPAADRSGRSGRSGLRRLVFLLPAGVAMLAGLDAALMLLGVPAPLSTDRLPDVHGMLMVLGFVGTLISLERVRSRSAGPRASPHRLCSVSGGCSCSRRCR